MKNLILIPIILISLWAIVPIIGLQFYSIDGIIVTVPNIPHICGFDWCAG